MEVSFLHASVPFAKTIRKTTHTQIENYPNIGIVTSSTHNWDSIQDLHTLILDQAQKGACILKGTLTRPLIKESRANATDPNTPTGWLVFDLDAVNVESAEEFIQQLPSEFHHCSYIEQLSSTAYFQTNKYKAHLFFHIPPTHPNTLRHFITNLNLDVFNTQITLSSGNLCLGYPLDISVNQNSTPLYIAPPVFVGLDDHIPHRIHLIEKDYHKIDNPIPEYSHAATLLKQKKTLTKLRQEIGLGSKTPKIEVLGKVELLKNIEPMATPIIREERGFTYLALNPNNPFSYYHPTDNPHIIYNFRGEPAFLTSKGLPEYWEQVKPRQLTPLIATPGSTPLIFRDRRRDLYYNGFHKNGDFKISPTKNITRLQHFAANCGIEAPEYIPDWEIFFDPTQIEEFKIDAPRINTFAPSPYLITCIEKPRAVTEIPPLIARILDSVTGNDEICLQHFINWLAFVFQKRTKTRTAWVFQGVEGTGKGLLFNRILTPLIGYNYCPTKTTNNLLDPFNEWMETCILLLVDEGKIFGRSRSEQLPNTLRNIITEPTQTLRLMRSNPFTAPSFCNLIFATNDNDALEISATDRRYNVCPPQKNPFPAYEEIEQDIEAELSDFAQYLYGYQVNEAKAHTAINNLAKEMMREARLPEADLFCKQLKTGNFLWFYDAYVEILGLSEGHTLFKSIIETWAKRWQQRGENTSIQLKTDELRACYNYLFDKNLTQIAFTRCLTRNQLMPKRSRMLDIAQSDKLRPGPRIPSVINITWKQGLDELLAL